MVKELRRKKNLKKRKKENKKDVYFIERTTDSKDRPCYTKRDKRIRPRKTTYRRMNIHNKNEMNRMKIYLGNFIPKKFFNYYHYN